MAQGFFVIIVSLVESEFVQEVLQNPSIFI